MFGKILGVVSGLVLMAVFTALSYAYYVYGYVTENPMAIWTMTILLGYGYIAVLLSTTLANFVEGKLRGKNYEKS